VLGSGVALEVHEVVLGSGVPLEVHEGVLGCGVALNNKLCGAEYRSRSHKLCSHSVDSQHSMKPEGSLPRSQELSTCTYPEPNQSSPQHSILSLKGGS
jgi:hypothetical protein